MLARVTGRHPAAAEILAQALRADLPGLGVPAVQVAAQTGGGLGRVLADVLGDAKATLHTLIQVQEAIPYPTAALAEANAVVTGRINQTLPVDTTPPETARWCDELGSAVRQAGHLARAVPPAKEAVRIYRQLAAAHPGTYRPDLANALTNLGLWYSELDRAEEALLDRVTKVARRDGTRVEVARPDIGQLRRAGAFRYGSRQIPETMTPACACTTAGPAARARQLAEVVSGQRRHQNIYSCAAQAPMPIPQSAVPNGGSARSLLPARGSPRSRAAGRSVMAGP